MPTCESCGNARLFMHEVHGPELRSYDDNGIWQDTKDAGVDTVSVKCFECGSPNVVWGSNTNAE